MKNRALANDISGASRTKVILDERNLVVVFFSLSSHSLFHANLKSSLKRNMPNPIPVLLLGRMGVDVSCHQMGLGRAMVGYSIKISRLASELYGIVGLIVKPINQTASFYDYLGFELIKSNSDFRIYRHQVNP